MKNSNEKKQHLSDIWRYLIGKRKEKKILQKNREKHVLLRMYRNVKQSSYNSKLLNKTNELFLIFKLQLARLVLPIPLPIPPAVLHCWVELLRRTPRSRQSGVFRGIAKIKFFFFYWLILISSHASFVWAFVIERPVWKSWLEMVFAYPNSEK